ncbi:MAG: hypothetical protein E2P02_12040 [Acidobacteria bacterium]|nr:MAG: hypothetical protein E2P02_12040 [Acidobacteriota bacterium]
MGHDQLFKDILKGFFREFLAMLYPEIETLLDFDTLRFLDKELFMDLPEGSRREADVVAEIRTLEGEGELILIHVEVQADPEPDFARRMYNYNALLWTRHQLPILPIVLYLHGRGEALTEETFQMTLLGREHVRFSYDSVRLASLKAEEYVEKSNVLWVALAALMERRNVDEPQLKASMKQRVGESKLDNLRKFLLVNVIETYFELDADQEEIFLGLLTLDVYKEARKMELTWADKLVEKGREEGRQEGREEGALQSKRDILLRHLNSKFGPLSEETTARVRVLKSLDELDAHLDRVLVAGSLKEMELEDGNA